MTSKLLLLLLFPVALFSQELKITGTIKDNQNRGIESASVLVLDDSENTLAFTFSEENGTFTIAFEKPTHNTITIVVSGLGYAKKEIKVDCSSKKKPNSIFYTRRKIRIS
ncbi:hypothetical protein BXU11_00070 [Flavobacterium sp. LM5]|uniref:carboxypeptidase-like regulatory domain-containing protein n=1 Tax=Flavobacterium sp. LM5 TaxID=1938610 RepID=UPI0009942978|nr:carboxypeptidase-like regulatory domain-containing protein [Flavobacterium sp. LM5]OOV28400.1 hypothetical protein BXU11_00070 [Flavobacterium sp. LM5]